MAAVPEIIGDGATRRPRSGDPAEYLRRRVTEATTEWRARWPADWEQMGPIAVPTVGVTYHVGIHGGTADFFVTFDAALAAIDDADEMTVGLRYRFENGVEIVGDPVFMPGNVRVIDEVRGNWEMVPVDADGRWPQYGLWFSK
jgi:hypothetical protein